MQLKPNSSFSFRRAAPFAGLAVLVGIVVVAVSLAAGPLAAFEPELGNLSGGATQATVTGASAGKAVQFNAAATPTPTPTASPGARSCPAFPAFPSRSCTGVPAGLTLTAYTGPTTITTAGTIIDSKNITSCLAVEAPNVIIRNSKVTCGSNTTRGSVYAGSTNLLIEDSELFGGNGPCEVLLGLDSASDSVVARRIYVHGCGDIFRVNGNFTLEDSYMEGMWNIPGDHNDGFQGYGPGGTAVIRHNYLDGNTQSGDGENGVIFFADGWNGNITIDQNYLIGSGFTLRLNENGHYYVHQNRILNNSWQYGPLNDIGGTIVEWVDNRLVNANGADAGSFSP